MSEIEEEVDPSISSAEAAIDAKSILKRIKENRDARGDTKKFPVPTWDGDLLLESQILEMNEIQAMIRRARAAAQSAAAKNGKSTAAATTADANFIVKACVGIWMINPDTGNEIKLIDSLEDEWRQLVDMLEPKWPENHPQAGEPIPIKSSQELVIYLVKWKGLVLATFGQRIGRWMQNPSIDFEDPQ